MKFYGRQDELAELSKIRDLSREAARFTMNTYPALSPAEASGETPPANTASVRDESPNISSAFPGPDCPEDDDRGMQSLLVTAILYTLP